MLLSVSRINKSFAGTVVLEDLSFSLYRGEKVALVGRNGAGKTTLLEILVNQSKPDSGTVLLERGAKVSYLAQINPVGSDRTVLQELEASQAKKLSLKNRLDELEKVLQGTPSQEDLDEYSLIHEHFLEEGAFSSESDIATVLKRLGFHEEEFQKTTSMLSGGEKTRLAIARMLLEEPDLLILDEPTNHLDFEATEWLEQWIRSYHGAVLLVSHDRQFLEATAERVLEMKNGAVSTWPGPFSQYLRLKQERDERDLKVAKQQEAEIAKLDEFVRRFMNSQRTAQARGRLKLMNRLIESKTVIDAQESSMKSAFGEVKRSGEIVILAESLTVGFPDLTLINPFDWTVRYQERWGIVGENGAGKSTLIQTILDQIPPLDGKARLGTSVQVGYFDQEADDLDLESSPLEVLTYECDLEPEPARKLLGRFLIVGEDVFRPLSTFSGGERNKVALARLTALNPNLLILDEPTNHLDMASREALADILRGFSGTLVLISHDRWLLGELTENILDIRNHRALSYPGGFNDYREKLKSGSADVNQNQSSKKGKAAKTLNGVQGDKAQPEGVTGPTLSPRELSKELERLKGVISGQESAISELESEIKSIENTLSDLPTNADVLEITRHYQQAQDELEGKLSVWESTVGEFDRLQALRKPVGNPK